MPETVLKEVSVLRILWHLASNELLEGMDCLRPVNLYWKGVAFYGLPYPTLFPIHQITNFMGCFFFLFFFFLFVLR